MSRKSKTTPTKLHWTETHSEWLAEYKRKRAIEEYEFFDGPKGINTLWPHQVWGITYGLDHPDMRAELQHNFNWVHAHIPDYGKRWIQMGFGFRFRDLKDAQTAELAIKLFTPKGLNS